MDDESNKAFVVTSRGARLVAAFTGLARAGSFETQTWLMESLSESMKVDGRLRLHRLCEIADRDFRSIGVSRADQLITVVLAGYVADGTDPDGTPTYPSLTWFTNGTTPSPWPLPTETVGDFTFGSVRDTRQNDFENCYSLGLGWVSAIPQKDIDGLTMMARAKKPPAAWVGTATRSHSARCRLTSVSRNHWQAVFEHRSASGPRARAYRGLLHRRSDEDSPLAGASDA